MISEGLWLDVAIREDKIIEWADSFVEVDGLDLMLSIIGFGTSGREEDEAMKWLAEWLLFRSFILRDAIALQNIHDHVWSSIFIIVDSDFVVLSGT